MKSTSKFTIFVLAFLTLAASAYAQSPRDELKQMVEQLQKTPNDNALRERIIKLAINIKPAPAIPEEANRVFVKGNVFQKEAKDASGFDFAISAYREALRSAPWWGDAYYNLAVALESAGKFDEAITSIKLYMASVPAGGAEAREAQNKIYALEAKGEMSSRQTKATESQIHRFEGEWLRDDYNSLGDLKRTTLTIRRDARGVLRVQQSYIIGSSVTENPLRDMQVVGTELRWKEDVRLGHTDGRIEIISTFEVSPTVSADGTTLRLAHKLMPFTASQEAYHAEWRPPSSYVDEYKKK